MDAAPANAHDRAFFGHPKGLMTLFFTEMWERFSFYGMRAFLVIYIATPIANGGLGESKATAGIIYAMYGSLVYLMSLPGGWLADRVLGQQRAVIYGGVVIMAGHIVLALPTHASFLPGLGLIILGTGLLKPNVSTIVGMLYDKNDPRRDGGYSIYYMGINVGAFIAPLACGYLAQSAGFRGHLANWGIDPNYAWHFGFGAAAIGMGAGVIQFIVGKKDLHGAGAEPTPRPAVRTAQPMSTLLVVVVAVAAAIITLFAIWRLSSGFTKEAIADSFGVGLATIGLAVFVIMHQVIAADASERARVLAMAVLFVGCVAFFGLFEQAGSTLSFFAEDHTRRSVFGIDFPSSYWQFVNAAWVIILAPIFTLLWVFLARRGKEPFSVNKFAIGMVIAGLAFVMLLPAIPAIDRGEKTSPLFLIVYYLFATTAEMCVSPVGLSVMNKLAPDRLASFVMGIWFLAISIGIYLAGRAEVEAGKLAHYLGWGTAGLFYLIMIFAGIVAVALFAVAGPVRRMLEGLPQATVRK